MSPDRWRGFSVLELLIAMALFSVLGLLGYAMLSQGALSWRRVSGEHSASLQLARAQRFLKLDLLQASGPEMAQSVVPPSLASSGDGHALWFLSAIDPATREAARKPDGTPLWLQNILYYLIVPNGHTDCSGGAGPGGLDDRCPHKVLIRKVIDLPPAGDLANPMSEESLLTDVAPYLTRPSGTDLSAMLVEPGVTRVDTVAFQMLWFEVRRPPDPRFPREVLVDLRAASLDELRRNVRVGVAPLHDNPCTVVRTLSVFPRN